MGTNVRLAEHTGMPIVVGLAITMALPMSLAACGSHAETTGDATTQTSRSVGKAEATANASRSVLISEKRLAQEILDWDDVVDISAGNGIMFGLRGDGTVRVANETDIGDGLRAELSAMDDVIAISGNNTKLVVLHDDGTVTSLANDRENHTDGVDSYDVHDDAFDTSGWEGITQVSSDLYAVGLTKDGTVVIAGNSIGSIPDHAYRIPDLSAWQDIRQVSTSNHLVAGLAADGTVVAAMSVEGDRPQDTTMDALRGATGIAAMEGFVAAVMPDGTVRVAGIDSPSECSDKFAVDGWTDVASISALDVSPGSRQIRAVLGVRKDGTVLYTSDTEANHADVTSWKSIRKACLYSTAAAIGLCESNEVATTIREQQENGPDNTKRVVGSPLFPMPDEPIVLEQAEIDAYDSEHRTSDGRWHGSWFSFVMPNGYEVAPCRKEAHLSSENTEPNRLVVAGSEDDFAEESDKPVILVGMLRDAAPRGIENMDEEGTYVAKTGITYRIFRITLYDDDMYEREYHTFTRYVAKDGDVSFDVTGCDVDDAIMHEFLDGFETTGDLVAHLAEQQNLYVG